MSEEYKNDFLRILTGKDQPREPIIDPNGFPEGSLERELKAAYQADEKSRKEAQKFPW